MVGFLSFMVGLLLGILIAAVASGYMLIEYYREDLDSAKEQIKINNYLLESIENHTIEIKTES